ncbi:MAG TPA: ribosome recycling factor [Pseudogracilibacillus sp.]|nr:ribosome recycling factor [Pseudogracilibacillus sp.]
MPQQILKDLNNKMQDAIQALTRNLATVRAGRANPSLLDSVYVEYYGTQTPLNQLATVGAPEARLLVITPFDKSAIGEIEKAILKADLGLSPSSDGNVIRLNIPPLTEERRRELTRVVGKFAEESRIQIRNIRREANERLRDLEKNGALTEDELRTNEDLVQKETDKYIAEVDEIVKAKEDEIMEV